MVDFLKDDPLPPLCPHKPPTPTPPRHHTPSPTTNQPAPPPKFHLISWFLRSFIYFIRVRPSRTPQNSSKVTFDRRSNVYNNFSFKTEGYDYFYGKKGARLVIYWGENRMVIIEKFFTLET